MKNGLKALSFFRNVVFLKWSSQIIFLVGLLYIIWSYIQNAVVNLEQTNIAFSWGWLGETRGDSNASGMYTLPNSGRQMIQVGMLNMLRVTVTGIFAATFLGTLAPLFTLLLESFLFKRKFNKFVIMGLLLSFCGAIIILSHNFDMYK